MRSPMVQAWCTLVAALLVASCGTMRSGGRWGEGATLRPGGARLLSAARGAALDPWTWGPLAGAGVIAIGGWDEDISDWAREETPVFGSQQDASDMSDDLHDLERQGWLVTVLATPSGSEAWPWAVDKAKGFAVEWSATFATSALTSELKSLTDRTRPDGSNERSFPSSHASDAFAYFALARRNLDAIDVSPLVRGSAKVGLGVVASGTAWARVEAGVHYPTDVLVGAALGNFVACFVHDAFLGLPEDVQVTASVEPDVGEWAIGLAFSF